MNAHVVPNLDAEFLAGVRAFKSELAAINDLVPRDAIPVPGNAIHERVLRALEASQQCCAAFEARFRDDVIALRQVQEYFRLETDPWMRQSWFSERAREKPSGFSGDYEMLTKLYDQATPARGLGGYLDLCLNDLPLARAVRARLAAAKQFLLNEIDSRPQGVRIMDIASGPCREYLDWPEMPSQKPVEIVAIDNDPPAIDFVRKQIIPGLSGATKLEVVRYNALRTRNAKATVERFGRFDIIYSVGLFDYLTDDHLIGMFAGLRDSLNENGVLYIAFKDTRMYDKTPYQWHLDWFFYQRTPEDVMEVYRRAGFDVDAIHTTRDATGIIINCISRHASSHIQRTDTGHSVFAPNMNPNQVADADKVQ